MSRSPDEEKKRRILQISFEAFGELGYKHTTIKYIADKVGVAPGTIYTYFEDKDALFLCAITEIWEQFALAAQSASDNQQKSFRLRAIELFGFGEELIRKSHTLLTGIFALPERRDLLRRNLDKATQALVPFFLEGRGYGLRLVEGDADYAFYQIKIILSGVLWDLALVEGQDFEKALMELKAIYAKEMGYAEE